MGIRFVKKLEPQWVSSDDMLFDLTEIGSLSKEQREQCSFLFAPLTESQREAFRKKAMDKAGNVDGTVFAEIIIQEHLLDWKGVLGEDGNLLPCNAEQKKQMIDFYPILASAWFACIRTSTAKQLQKENERKEILEKN